MIELKKERKKQLKVIIQPKTYFTYLYNLDKSIRGGDKSKESHILKGEQSVGYNKPQGAFYNFPF